MDETDDDDPWVAGEDVWLVDISHCSPSEKLLHNERYLGYQLGTLIVGENSRPLYAIKHQQEITGIVQLYNNNFDDYAELDSTSRIWTAKLVGDRSWPGRLGWRRKL